MYPFYLGIDLHLKRTYMVLMDAKGEIINKGRISQPRNNKISTRKSTPRDLCGIGNYPQLAIHV